MKKKYEISWVCAVLKEINVYVNVRIIIFFPSVKIFSFSDLGCQSYRQVRGCAFGLSQSYENVIAVVEVEMLTSFISERRTYIQTGVFFLVHDCHQITQICFWSGPSTCTLHCKQFSVENILASVV